MDLCNVYKEKHIKIQCNLHEKRESQLKVQITWGIVNELHGVLLEYKKIT